MKWFVYVGLVVLFVVIVLTPSVVNIVEHELAHQQIFASYGVNSTISYSFSGGVTTAGGSGCTEGCQILHELNEIVTYNLQSVSMAIVGTNLMLFLIFCKMGRN